MSARLPGRRHFFTERYYFPNFVVAVAELLAMFGSNVVAMTVARLFTSKAMSALLPRNGGHKKRFPDPIAAFFNTNQPAQRSDRKWC